MRWLLLVLLLSGGVWAEEIKVLNTNLSMGFLHDGQQGQLGAIAFLRVDQVTHRTELFYMQPRPVAKDPIWGANLLLVASYAELRSFGGLGGTRQGDKEWISGIAGAASKLNERMEWEVRLSFPIDGAEWLLCAGLSYDLY